MKKSRNNNSTFVIQSKTNNQINFHGNNITKLTCLYIFFIFAFCITVFAQPTFQNIAADMGVAKGNHTTGACWGDIDGDGDLDLYVAPGGSGGDTPIHHLYKNLTQSFREVTTELGIKPDGNWASSASFIDYDNDGDLDIWVAETDNRSTLYKNQNGSFVDITCDVGLDILQTNSMISKIWASSWVDYDNDGDVDIILGGQIINDERIAVFRNDFPNHNFTLVDIGLKFLSYSACWSDYDNDGDLDIYANGNPHGLFRNDVLGNGKHFFTQISNAFPNAVSGYGGSWGDYDNDGDMDIYIIQMAWPNPKPNVL